jgi:hypothetical protein
MRRDLGLTDKEFINLLKEYISKRGIKVMFENANLEKDEQLLLNNDVYEEFLTKNMYTLDVKNTFENFKATSFEFRQPIKQYKEKFVA